MHLRGVRFLTALVVISACAVALFRGWDIVRFSAANAAISDDAKQASVVHPWIAVPGLAFVARESSLTVVTDSRDEANTLKRRDEQAEILSVRPMSSKYWLMLSEMRFVTKEPTSKVAAAFEFSVLTGANEDYIMSGRGIYGVAHWEILPPELQRRSAADLGATTNLLSDGQIAGLRKILSEKTEPVRQDIGTALQNAGFSAKKLVAIGLQN